MNGIAPPIAAAPPARLTRGSARTAILFVALAGAILSLLLLELAIGPVRLPLREVIGGLTGSAADYESAYTIVRELRLPRALAAILAGSALGVASLLMQTILRNPLADPWLLGIVAGARLGVAVALMTAGLVSAGLMGGFAWLGVVGLGTAAIAGGAVAMVGLLAIAPRVDVVTLLILGLMFNFLAGGLASVALHFTPEALGRVFSAWADASFAGVTWPQLRLLAPVLLAGIAGAMLLVKPLNALLLGDRYAASAGTNVPATRVAALTCTAVLAGAVTAACGPIAFVGIAAAHLCRNLFGSSDHRVVLPGCVLMGALLAQGADLVVNLPWERHFLHLNDATALVGAPVVAWAILRRFRAGRPLSQDG